MAAPKLQLCADLRPICDFEIAKGNLVAGVAAPVGTKCAYAVSFAEPLAFIGTPAAENLPAHVQYWECRDPHYEIEAGYFCSTHKHSIAGPIEGDPG